MSDWTTSDLNFGDGGWEEKGIRAHRAGGDNAGNLCETHGNVLYCSVSWYSMKGKLMRCLYEVVVCYVVYRPAEVDGGLMKVRRWLTLVRRVDSSSRSGCESCTKSCMPILVWV